MITDYDVAILGGGLAGLSLAVRLAEPRFAHLRVLVIEARIAYRRDRTWSYWALRPHPFQAAVSASWKRWAVMADDRTAIRSAPGLVYETIPADRLYDQAVARLAAAPHVELRLGTVADAVEEPECVRLQIAGETVRAGVALDTRPPSGIGRHGLTQIFLGQEIHAARPVFDAGCATLMDFRGTQAGAAHFIYVLPSSPHCALVEDTWFAPAGFSPPDHRAAIRDDLARRGAGDFTVLFEERGALPMDPVFQPRPGRRLVPLGIAGGASRPSTGYAFNAIQAHCDAIAADLASGRLPRPAPRRSGLVRWMDHVMLELLERRPEQAARVFTSLFAHCPPRSLVRFLNDMPSPADLAAVAAAIPLAPTSAAAARLTVGRMSWPRPAPVG